jgi:pyruvate formate lyase activating enzyme
MSAEGLTFNIQRFSTEDGPGIRTTVFMKGCPLHCAWCHNPEGLTERPDLVWYDVRCVGARECLLACGESGLTLSPAGLQIDRARCTLCGQCVAACPAGALELIGRSWTPAALLRELLKDAVFYESSAGGITFSGGEPMAQVAFLGQVLPLCREAGLHVALDTCGAAPWHRYEQILPWVDLVLYDLKIFDQRRHLDATGVRNERILRNVRRLADAGVPLWIRTPIVPGYTGDWANLLSIARFIGESLPSVERWDLLAYTNLGQPKYHRLDRPYLLEGAPLLQRDEMQALWESVVEWVPVARWSGTTA